MAHFAQLDNNVVTRVIVISNSDIIEDGLESEEKGIEICKNLLGENTVWVQTSYNGTFRKRYAGIGYTYSNEYDAFIPPKPYPSWVLNTIELVYEAPYPSPTDGPYLWNESLQIWESVL